MFQLTKKCETIDVIGDRLVEVGLIESVQCLSRIYVRATIYVERETQKGILIGKKGRMLKKIGQIAREEIEKWMGAPVYLDLWVTTKPDWRDKERDLRDFGY